MTGPQDIAASIAALYPEIAATASTSPWPTTRPPGKARHHAPRRPFPVHPPRQGDAEACLRGVQCAASGHPDRAVSWRTTAWARGNART